MRQATIETLDMKCRSSKTGPAIGDYLSLLLAVLAKVRRRALSTKDQRGVTDFYEDFFVEKDIREWSVDARRSLRRTTLAEYFSTHRLLKVSVLDVGCGFGEVLTALPESCQLQGLDFSAANVGVAERLLGFKSTVKQGSIFDIPFESASQDVCLCLEVLEHIDDDSRGVQEIVRVMRPGGILIASVPHTYYWPQYRRLIGHYRHYTRESFEALLEANGLVVVEHLPNYPNWHRAYSRLYCWVRFLTIMLGPLTGQRDVYAIKMPLAKEPVMQKGTRRLEPILKSDGGLDYRLQDSSTFVVARKRVDVETCE